MNKHMKVGNMNLDTRNALGVRLFTAEKYKPKEGPFVKWKSRKDFYKWFSYHLKIAFKNHNPNTTLTILCQRALFN